MIGVIGPVGDEIIDFINNMNIEEKKVTQVWIFILAK